MCETYKTGGTVTLIRTVSPQTLTVYFGGKTFSLKDNGSPLQSCIKERHAVTLAHTNNAGCFSGIYLSPDTDEYCLQIHPGTM